MACGQVLGVFPFRMWVTSTQEVWQALSSVVALPGAKELDFALTVVRLSSNVVAIPAVQLAPGREEQMGAPAVATGTWNGTNDNTSHHDTDLTAVTDKYLARAGVLAKLASGATAGWIEGRLSVVLRRCSLAIGQREIEVAPSQNTANPTFYRLGVVPAAGADKLRASIVYNAAKDLEVLFYARGADDRDKPAAWTAIGTWTGLTTEPASAICLADASVSAASPGSFHLLELAVAVRLKTGGSNPAGFLRVSAGLSYT